MYYTGVSLSRTKRLLGVDERGLPFSLLRSPLPVVRAAAPQTLRSRSGQKDSDAEAAAWCVFLLCPRQRWVTGPLPAAERPELAPGNKLLFLSS